jgi:uncharacterized C2H2 Zn-finger protein
VPVDLVDNDEPPEPITSRRSWPLRRNIPQPQSERQQQPPNVNAEFNDDVQQEPGPSGQQAPPHDADDDSTDSVQEAVQRAAEQFVQGRKIRKKLKCPTCKRKIADSRGYKKHVQECPKKCPFLCKKCGWRFNSAQAYTRHHRSECAKGSFLLII